MAYSRYSTKPSYNSRQTINIRNWTDPKSPKPLKSGHDEDLERGRIRRKTEDYLDEWMLQANIKEIWD